MFRIPWKFSSLKVLHSYLDSQTFVLRLHQEEWSKQEMVTKWKVKIYTTIHKKRKLPIHPFSMKLVYLSCLFKFYWPTCFFRSEYEPIWISFSLSSFLKKNKKKWKLASSHLHELICISFLINFVGVVVKSFMCTHGIQFPPGTKCY